MRLLIAYDGSPFADAAIDDLVNAGLPRVVEAKVLTVADVWPQLPAMYREAMVPGPAELSMTVADTAAKMAEQARREAEELATRAAARVAGLFPDWEATSEAQADSPAEAIVREAARWPADLLVVGFHGRGALGRLFFGSVSQKVVKYAPCSVRVGRRVEHRVAGPLRIMIGLDTSDSAAAAVSAAAQRAWPRETVVHLVTAMDVRLVTALPLVDLPGAPIAEDPHELIKEVQKQVAEELRAAGLAVTTAIKDGDPKHVLLDEAESWHADCVFVGAKGTTAVERFLLGSVAGALAAHAHCSVEVVRFGA
jgi:nucleotide-binding universal stress UspA family protein